MKYQIAILALAFVGFNSFAMTPVPNPVFQVTIGGGMPVPGGVMRKTLTIREDLSVRLEVQKYSKDLNNLRPEEKIERLDLGTAEATDLALAVEALNFNKAPQLVGEKGPDCMDAPAVTYVVFKNGVAIPFYRNFNCRDFAPANKSRRKAALEVKAYLDAWL